MFNISKFNSQARGTRHKEEHLLTTQLFSVIPSEARDLKLVVF